MGHRMKKVNKKCAFIFPSNLQRCMSLWMQRKENKPLPFRKSIKRRNVKDNEMKNKRKRNVCKEWEWKRKQQQQKPIQQQKKHAIMRHEWKNGTQTSKHTGLERMNAERTKKENGTRKKNPTSIYKIKVEESMKTSAMHRKRL